MRSETRRPQHPLARERLIDAMSLSFRWVFGVVRMLLLILGAYLLIDFLLPALVAVQAAV